MVLSHRRMLAAAVCLVGMSCPGNVAAQDPAGGAKAFEGLWSGSWGGGERDGVVFQPVNAELVIQGDHVELYGFRNVSRLSGTVRFDAAAKRVRVTPTAGGQPSPKVIEFTYEIKGDVLTLLDGDQVSVSLQRHRVVLNPLAHAQAEFVEATGINDAGDLLVTEFTVLRAGRARANFFQPVSRSLKTDRAAILLVQETGWKTVTVDEARRLIRDGTISGGMIPKVEGCIEVVEAGVEAVVIIDGRVPHCVLLELFTEHGVGTLVTRKPKKG